MPPPNFGRRLDKGRFDRMLRCLARGPGGCEDANDPWHATRPWVGGYSYNKTRRREFQWGWCAVVDETMFAWRGKGRPGRMPHVSCMPRKPEDLSCELKTACDGASGVMMFMEIQEGQARVRRKQWHQKHGATTSCTPRRAKESGFAEARRRPEERGQRVFLGDSLYLFEERSDEVHSMVVRSTADQTHLEYNNLLSLSTCKGIEYYTQLATVHTVQKIEW
jgi:hypothetical protein